MRCVRFFEIFDLCRFSVQHGWRLVCQIPAWIKQELHDVPDDESDQSDDDVTTKATNDGHDSSMSSIHINKDLKSGACQRREL